MLSQLRILNVEHEDKIMMDYNAPARRSLQHQMDRTSKEKVSRGSKEKVLSPRGVRSMKLQTNGRLLKSGKPIKQNGLGQHPATTGETDAANSVPPVAMGNCHKPCPGGKVAGVEEVVKYMSNVPSYLQRSGSGANVQEKALNFGVLDWGLLERWTYGQKHMTTGRGGISPSSSNESSLFSAFGSSSRSYRSSGSSLPQGKRLPSKCRHQNSFAECHISKKFEEVDAPDSRTSPGNRSAWQSHKNNMSSVSNENGVSCNKTQPPDTGDSTSKNYVFAFAPNKVKGHIGTSIAVETSCKQQSSSRGLHSIGHRLGEQASEVNGTLEHVQGSDTVLNNVRPEEVKCNDFSGNFLHEEIHFTSLSPNIPCSCPLASTTQREKPFTACPPATKSKGKHEQHEQSATDSSEQFAASMVDRIGQDELTSGTAQPREQLSHHLSSVCSNKMRRNSNSREGSPGRQMEQNSCPDNFLHNKVTGNVISRWSTLKRILEPALKSKNRFHDSGPIPSSHIDHALEELASTKGSCKVDATNINSSSSQEAGFQDSVQEEKHVASTSQAILKLAWKNGLPFLMLSSDDNNILAATLGKRIDSTKSELECIYTIFTAHEVKKKSGIWITQGNKAKKHSLVYNVVGQMKISQSTVTSYGSGSHTIMREFVLFGSGLITSNQNNRSSLLNKELAAIVVEVPKERPGNAKDDVLYSSNSKEPSCMDSKDNKFSCCQVENMQNEQTPDNSIKSSILVILPSGVHGLSYSGEPSPLIDRWKSGGSCDCGGWDEGCMLKILTDKVQETKRSDSVQACQSISGTHHIQLFVQGGARRHVFSIIASNAEMYTVGFGSSIDLLQAFAICIAILHSGKFNNCSQLHCSAGTKSLSEQVLADCTRTAPARNKGRVPTSYVPYHPPQSPVGRV